MASRFYWAAAFQTKEGKSELTHWLYPANLKFYDVLGALAEPETYWPMNSKTVPGDHIFIYLATSHIYNTVIERNVECDAGICNSKVSEMWSYVHL